MKLKQTLYWCRDWIYPSPEGINSELTPAKTDWLLKEPPSGVPLESAYSWLKEQLKAEEDRFKTIENKLLGILPLSSTVITLLLALITFLTNGRAAQYTKPSILLTTWGGAYVAMQFLAAFFRAINGLYMRSYIRADLNDIIPQPNDTQDTYIRRSFNLLAEIFQHNAEINNSKLTQLACAHKALKNGVVGLFIVLVLFLLITTFGRLG